MPSRPWLSFLLSLFLLFAQQAVVLHEIDHVREASANSSHQEGQPSAQQHCTKCLALAPFIGAVASTPSSQVFGAFTETVLPPSVAVPVGIAHLVLRNRGPPPFL